MKHNMRLDIDKVMILLAERGLSYKAFCKKAHTTETEFRYIRNGIRKPKPLTIGKFATTLGVEVKDIIIQEGD